MSEAPAHENNFDLLRLAAATAVLVSHCYPLTGSGEDPLADLTGHTAGELGVTVFFAISGYLVTLSWLSDPAPGRFAARRGLRLLPGLAVVTLLTTFVLGPLFTTLSLGAYLTDPTPWIYAVRTSVLVTINGTLPGVFADNPFPNAVNGSLWTLPVEALAYVMVVGAGLLGLLRTARLPLLVAGGLVAALLASSWSPIDVSGVISSGAAGAGIPAALRLAAVFVGGMVLAHYRDRIPLRFEGVVVAVVAWALARNTGLEPFVAAAAMPYAVLVLALRHRVAVPLYERGGDASYGIYVYAFPVQQAVAALIDGVSAGVMLAISFPVTFVLARASWWLVEQPALRRKPRRRTEPLPA